MQIKRHGNDGISKSKRRFSLPLKLNLLIIAIILSVSTGLVCISYRTYRNKIDSLYYSEVEKLAEAVSLNFTENLIKPLTAMVMSEEFQTVREQAEKEADPSPLEQ